MEKSNSEIIRQNPKGDLALIEEFMLSLPIDVSPHTITCYKIVLVKLMQGTHKPLLDLTAEEIRNFIIGCKENGSWKTPATFGAYIVRLKRFYNWLVEEGYSEDKNNPMRRIKPPRAYAETTVTRIGDDELRKLIQTAELEAIPLRSRLIFHLILSTGLRGSEAAAIRIENINLNHQLIYIPPQDTKGKRLAKLVPFSYKSKQLMEQYLLQNPVTVSPYLFHQIRDENKKLHRKIIYDCISEIVYLTYPYEHEWHKAAGPHILRHTFATKWIESKCDITALKVIMGWKSLKQVDRYVHVSETFVRQEVKNFDKALKKLMPK